MSGAPQRYLRPVDRVPYQQHIDMAHIPPITAHTTRAPVGPSPSSAIVSATTVHCWSFNPTVRGFHNRTEADSSGIGRQTYPFRDASPPDQYQSHHSTSRIDRRKHLTSYHPYSGHHTKTLYLHLHARRSRSCCPKDCRGRRELSYRTKIRPSNHI